MHNVFIYLYLYIYIYIFYTNITSRCRLRNKITVILNTFKTAQPPTNEHALNAHSIYSISCTDNPNRQPNTYRLSLDKCCNQICEDSRQTAQSRMASALMGSSAFVWWLCTRARVVVLERINALRAVNWFNKLIQTHEPTHTHKRATKSHSHRRQDGS